MRGLQNRGLGTLAARLRNREQPQEQRDDRKRALGARHSPAGAGGGMAQSAERTLDASVPSELQQLTRVVEELKTRVEVLEQKMSLASIEAKDA